MKKNTIFTKCLQSFCDFQRKKIDFLDELGLFIGEKRILTTKKIRRGHNFLFQSRAFSFSNK
jgi:hypothetical protein